MPRRTQVLVIELRPGAPAAQVGQLVMEEAGPFDVQGWIVQAGDPVEE